MIATSRAEGEPGRLQTTICCAFILLLLAVPLSASSSLAEFVRIAAGSGGQPLALEVAIARFERDEGTRVDLVGAVHIGEPEYFQALNQRLATYQRVLYELVADPEASRPAPVSPGMSIISMMQGGMKNALGLAFQLEQIDYSPSSFVHADLSPQQFSRAMSERDESLGGLLVRAWALGMAQNAGAAGAQANVDLLKVLLAGDRQVALRRMLAQQLIDQGNTLELIGGAEGTTLIEGRNARALEVLERELAAGHDHLAIFYGAGHLPDFARRLEQDFGFRHVGTEWLTAWDLR